MSPVGSQGKDALALAHTVQGAEPLMTLPRGFRLQPQQPGPFVVAVVVPISCRFEVASTWCLGNSMATRRARLPKSETNQLRLCGRSDHVESYPNRTHLLPIFFVVICYALTPSWSTFSPFLRTVSGIFEDDKGRCPRG